MLILYKNKSSDNTLNKTLTEPLEIRVILKRDIDLTNPELILRDVIGYDLTEYNYCEISELNRFYFIDSIESITNETNLFRCTCDVLSTYKLDILQCNARLKRSLKTGDYMSLQLDESVKKNVETFASDVSLTTDKTIILTTVGV